MDQGAIVTYKEFSRKNAGICGLVEGLVQDRPDYVWVRWIGNSSRDAEYVFDLEEI